MVSVATSCNGRASIRPVLQGIRFLLFELPPNHITNVALHAGAVYAKRHAYMNQF